MILLAFVLAVLLGTGSLAVGYYQAGLFDPARWWVWLGIVWLLAYWRKYYWFSSIALLLSVFAAAYGVWREFPTIWMLLGALGALLGWDLSDFTMRLPYAAPTADVKDMERRHLARVGVVAALGVGLAVLSLFIRVRRLAFEIAVGLALLTALVLIRVLMKLRKF